MDSSLTAALGVGFLLGIRHATDADHVAAVSAFVSQERSLRRSCLLGTFWGAGHGATLLLVGMGAVLFKLTISPRVAQGIEMAVGVALILLGGHVLLRSLGTWRLHGHVHSHDGYTHSHLHLHLGGPEAHAHHHLLRMGARPFVMGILHGMAGSAALMLLVLATIPSPLGALAYILVFGVGSTAGMLLLSGVISIPFAFTADRWRTTNTVLQMLTGASSLILGLVLTWDIAGP
jgi:high-affinity nickel-transport protein